MITATQINLYVVCADVRMKETGSMSHISCLPGVHLSLKVFDCGST
jgi:hypothetical protein